MTNEAYKKEFTELKAAVDLSKDALLESLSDVTDPQLVTSHISSLLALRGDAAEVMEILGKSPLADDLRPLVDDLDEVIEACRDRLKALTTGGTEL